MWTDVTSVQNPAVPVGDPAEPINFCKTDAVIGFEIKMISAPTAVKGCFESAESSRTSG